MRAAVVHHFWEQAGGGQLVCAAAAYTLNSIGFNTLLASTVMFDPSKYVEWFGINLSNYETFSLFRIRMKAFGIYLRLTVSLLVKKIIEKFKPRLIFIDESTYGAAASEIKKFNIALIEYIHFPFEILANSELQKLFRDSRVYYGRDPYVTERYGKFPMNIYWRIYTYLLPRFMRSNPFESALVVLTNSKWTANLVKEIYGESPRILNPPIPPGTQIISEPIEFEYRQPAVVLLGRFSEEKRYHWVIEELTPQLIKEVPGIRVYIIGSAVTRTSRTYLSKIEALARKIGLRISYRCDNNVDVCLIPNASRETVNRFLDSSRIFLHATINEHWGIAVAEAMARGLPIVVHKSGGTWSDLASEGEFGLGYSNKEEAVKQITELLVNNKLWKYYSQKSIERCRELTLNSFADKLSQIVKKQCNL